MKNETYKIALIGAGQLGSRYLQGIVISDIDIELYIVDPSNDSIRICHKRILEAKPAFNIANIINLNQVTSLPKNIDLAIIATTADVRWKVINELFKQDRKINYAILEKVLFQKELEYSKCEALLKEKNVISWVNCPRRIMPIYEDLKNDISEDLREVKVTGTNWGLISNTIHLK